VSRAASSPTPVAIRAARDAANLTQTEAGMVVHTSCRTWQQWEAGDRRMHPAFWELFRMKVGLRVRTGNDRNNPVVAWVCGAG